MKVTLKKMKALKDLEIYDGESEVQPVKKLQLSQEQYCIMKKTENNGQITTKQSKEIKGQNVSKQQQDQILHEIENKNIEKSVQDLISKFIPPICKCSNRKADKLCVNKGCGDNRMNLICGKCHLNQHIRLEQRSEMDIEEYFIKIATFINSQKQASNQQALRINTLKLETAILDIQNIRNNLSNLKDQLQAEIVEFQSPQQMFDCLSDSITKMLSLDNYDKMQSNLKKIKNCVVFKENKFFWNDSNEKFGKIQKSFNKLNQDIQDFENSILNSFEGAYEIDLKTIKLILCSQISSQQNDLTKPKYIDNHIVIEHSQLQFFQYYLNYPLSNSKIYKIRFRLDSIPQQYLYFGVFPKNMLVENYISDYPEHQFYKSFGQNSQEIDCSRIIQGTSLIQCQKQGMQIEMRIDLSSKYIDFCDYPERENINANNEGCNLMGQDYVIAFYTEGSLKITIESLIVGQELD